MLEFDPETLSTKGFHYFNKSSENIGKTSSATTHLETDPNNGDLIGLAGIKYYLNTTKMVRHEY
jgi:hypothetical protein